MHAHHAMAGAWSLMLHYAVFGYYDKQGSRRGDDQVGSINWAMLMGSHPLAGGRLTLRTMVSAEALTVTPRGYPLLLQTGESYKGNPLHDRQHPHDLFMELAALYEHPLTSSLGVSLYLAPVGEPAIGPVAFMHRPSAIDDPFAPIAHHWQDATHISFGVITGGLFTRHMKLEGSIFNGREPDEVRTNFDYKGRHLDSYAGRLTVNPNVRWSVSGSYAYLKSPEASEPDESMHRMSASALYSRPLGTRGSWSSTLIYGANAHSSTPDHLSHSGLVESTLDLDGRHAIFGRAEMVQKSAADLVLATVPGDQTFNVGEVTLGYMHGLAQFGIGSGRVMLGVGVSGTVNFVPSTLLDAYGTKTPAGFGLYLSIQPATMSHAMHMSEPGDHMQHMMQHMPASM
jgi:hypothetical protein